MVAITDRESYVKSSRTTKTRRGVTPRAPLTESFLCRQSAKGRALLRDWKQGGHGWLSDRKPHNVVRVILENYNSLKYWTKGKRDRTQTMDDTRRRLQADVQAGCEVQVDWSLLGRGDPKYHDLFVTLENRKSVVAWNEHERSAPSQVGRVAHGRAGHTTTNIFDRQKPIL